MSRLAIGDTVRLRSSPSRHGTVQDLLSEDDGSWVLVTWLDAAPTAHLEEDVELVSSNSN